MLKDRASAGGYSAPVPKGPRNGQKLAESPEPPSGTNLGRFSPGKWDRGPFAVRQTAPVTPEVAGSSPVAPVSRSACIRAGSKLVRRSYLVPLAGSQSAFLPILPKRHALGRLDTSRFSAMKGVGRMDRATRLRLCTNSGSRTTWRTPAGVLEAAIDLVLKVAEILLFLKELVPAGARPRPLRLDPPGVAQVV